MNWDNSKISDVHRLKIGLKEKMDLQRDNKRVTLSEVSIYYNWKIMSKY